MRLLCWLGRHSWVSQVDCVEQRQRRSCSRCPVVEPWSVTTVIFFSRVVTYDVDPDNPSIVPIQLSE